MTGRTALTGTTLLVAVSLLSGCGIIQSLLSSAPDWTDGQASGLVAAWTFDGSGAVAVDSSGNGIDGQIHGATRVGGLVGNALAFNGLDNWVEVPNSPVLASLTQLTIDLWIYPTGWPSSGLGNATGIVAYGTADHGMWELRLAGQGAIYLLLNWQQGNPSSQTDIVTDPGLVLDRWQRITVSYDGQMARLYIDATLVKAEAASPWTYAGDSSRLGIGNDFPGISEYFQGKLDEVRIYNRALIPGSS